MAKHFGERRDPSMGSRAPEERQEADDLKLKKKPVHRATTSVSPEDALIAQIDARKNKDRTSMGARQLTPSEIDEIDDPLEAEQRRDLQMAAANKYEDKASRVPAQTIEINPDTNLQSNPKLAEDLKTGPAGYRNESPPAQNRYQSSIRKSLSAERRRVRKKGTAKK